MKPARQSRLAFILKSMTASSRKRQADCLRWPPSSRRAERPLVGRVQSRGWSVTKARQRLRLRRRRRSKLEALPNGRRRIIISLIIQCEISVSLSFAGPNAVTARKEQASHGGAKTKEMCARPVQFNFPVVRSARRAFSLPKVTGKRAEREAEQPAFRSFGALLCVPLIFFLFSLPVRMPPLPHCNRTVQPSSTGCSNLAALFRRRLDRSAPLLARSAASTG